LRKSSHRPLPNAGQSIKSRFRFEADHVNGRAPVVARSSSFRQLRQDARTLFAAFSEADPIRRDRSNPLKGASLRGRRESRESRGVQFIADIDARLPVMPVMPVTLLCQKRLSSLSSARKITGTLTGPLN